MRKKIFVILTLVDALLLAKAWAVEEMWAQDQTAQEARDEQIYGSQLMTDRERATHREKLRAASSEEERAKIRRDHHELMRERAEARGITLPDEPPGDRGHHGMEHHAN